MNQLTVGMGTCLCVPMTCIPGYYRNWLMWWPSQWASMLKWQLKWTKEEQLVLSNWTFRSLWYDLTPRSYLQIREIIVWWVDYSANKEEGGWNCWGGSRGGHKDDLRAGQTLLWMKGWGSWASLRRERSRETPL